MRSWTRDSYPFLWAAAAHNLACACLETGDRDRAVVWARQALEVRTEMTDILDRAVSVNTLAMALPPEEGAVLLSATLKTLASVPYSENARSVIERNYRSLSAKITQGTATAKRGQISIPEEVEIARRQIRSLIGMRNGPLVRPGLQLAHRLMQATSVSGDFYRIITRGDGSIGISLVDVEGHGIAASSAAVAIEKTLFRPGNNWGTGDARAQLEAADALVEEELSQTRIAVSMNFLEVDPRGMKARYAGAGMPYPMLFSSGSSEPVVMKAVGIYVGAGYRRTPSQPDRFETDLHEGDLIVMYSDGIPEAADSQGRLFGQHGVEAAVLSEASKLSPSFWD